MCPHKPKEQQGFSIKTKFDKEEFESIKYFISQKHFQQFLEIFQHEVYYGVSFPSTLFNQYYFYQSRY